MHKFATLLTTSALVLSGLVLSPANAATVTCGGGGNFTITGNQVTAVSNDCDGVVSIPEGVMTFSPSVFRGLAITEFILPSTFVGYDVYIDFSELRDLTKFTVSDSNSNYSADSSGVLFNKDKTTVLLYPQGKTDFSYAIPWGVQRIGNASFYSAQFTSVEIPRTVTNIGVSAFLGSSLTSVVIPASVTTLRYYAFRGNQSLSTVTFAGDPPGPTGETDVFMDVTATVRVSQWQTSAWTAKLLDYNDQYTNLTLSSGNVYNFYNNGGVGHEPTPQWLSESETWFTTPTNSATRQGYTFVGWNSQPDRSGRSYLPGIRYANAYDDVNLYAQWSANSNTVTFDSTGGTEVSTGSFLTGGSMNAPTEPTRNGYTFAGWALEDTDVTITFPYSPRATDQITLHAVWTRNPVKARVSVKPTISGKATSSKKGTNKLTAKQGTWTGYPAPTVALQWYMCTKQVTAATQTIPTTCKTISKATKSSLAVTNSFKGKYLAVRVVGKGAGTTATQWLSKSTTKVK